MKVKESLNLIFDESLTHTILSPLADDDVGEEETIRNNTKGVNNNNKEDESIEVDEVVNIKEIIETQANDHDHLVNYDNDNDNDDLGYESELYLDEEEEDENNHSNGNVVKTGITRLFKFRREYGKPNEIKLSVKSAVDKMARSKSVYQNTIGRGRYVHVKKKMKETEDKIKDETLKFDHGTDAMTVLLGKEKGGYARGVGSGVTYKRYFELPRSRQASDERIALLQSQLDNERFERQEKELVSLVDINPIDSSADEEGGTPLSVVGCENDASIQKSNGLATSEKKIETRKSTIIALGTVYKTDGKEMLHNKEHPKDCYKVSVDKSLVDAACIPDVGNNGFKTFKDGVGGFFAWTKNKVVLDPKVRIVLNFKKSAKNQANSTQE
uniref:DUF8039 domain-containing protein n=1 Tax=Tanacetum cinerariifolium TaxID=118510 RepID=A0A6L2KNB1_TANCI|nr:hypothetical protein [Tanacetum cinerariifolium]